jgi:exopolyphosphatase/pppGpp-phosphohydrolase
MAIAAFSNPRFKKPRMDEGSAEELDTVSGTVGTIQRIAMAMVELPPEERIAHYTVVRTSFAAAIKELGVEDTIANAWLDKTMD